MKTPSAGSWMTLHEEDLGTSCTVPHVSLLLSTPMMPSASRLRPNTDALLEDTVAVTLGVVPSPTLSDYMVICFELTKNNRCRKSKWLASSSTFILTTLLSTARFPCTGLTSKLGNRLYIL